ncbi:LIM/homeobox protein Lhx5 [Paramyrothecium foliicola]|nr:LIM/homeobox protein Lhx5 [Paramyrothecium foliicola]
MPDAPEDTSLRPGTPNQQQNSSPTSHNDSSLSQSFFESQDVTADTSDLSQSAEKHPKGKRKRTAAKDKMILEEAYLRNPKPDKQARLEVVQRVSLNEKEVQIWFQNRRQNDRRKSRPLSPQEIAALRYGHMHTISSDPISQNLLDTPDPTVPSSDPALPLSTILASTPPGPKQHSPELTKQVGIVPGPVFVPISQESITGAQNETPARPTGLNSSPESRDGSQTLSHSFSGSVGYLANRWHLERSFSAASAADGNDDSFRLDMFPPSSDPTNSASQAHMRLSLSLEGKAEVVSSAPSPTRTTPSRPSSTLPTLPQVHQRSLQRSHSALAGVTLPPISALTSSLPPPSLTRGRSRDVHAWELCADADTRDELTAQAERESSGSAVAAISLLRSSSSVLQPSGSKRNASLNRQPRPDNAKKAKLSRAHSSVARLETIAKEVQKVQEGDKGKGFPRLLSPTDSDKENWSPDEDGNPHASHRSRLLPSKAPMAKSQNPRRLGRVLQMQAGPALLGGRANTAPARHDKGAVEIFEDGERQSKKSGAKGDEEVEHFMRGDVPGDDEAAAILTDEMFCICSNEGKKTKVVEEDDSASPPTLGPPSRGVYCSYAHGRCPFLYNGIGYQPNA